MSPREWWHTLERVKANVDADNVSVLAAGIAFYGFLGLFPAIATCFIVYGLIADTAAVQSHLAPLREAVPNQAYEIIAVQLRRVASTAHSALGVGLAFSLALEFWGATKGIKVMLTALDVVYKESKPRNFLRRNVVVMLFTVGSIIFGLVALAVLAVIPTVIGSLGIGGRFAELLLPLRWIVLAALIIVALGILYHFGPSPRARRPVWMSVGAIAGSVLWLVVSLAFSFYVTNFGNYDEIFGSLGAVVVLMFWLYLSAYVVCLGAELNAELEHWTYRDPTAGPARFRGTRRTHVAGHTATRQKSGKQIARIGMYSIFYVIGVIVVVLAALSLLG